MSRKDSRSIYAKIIVGNTVYKMSYFWVRTFGRLGLMRSLSFEEKAQRYSLVNENQALRAIVRKQMMKDLNND